MNKKILIFLFLQLYVIDVFAAEKTDQVFALYVLNNRGIEVAKDIVIIKNNSLIVNNEKLTPVEIITQSDDLKNISRFSADKKTNCPAGIFKHIYLKGKIKKVEYGCIESERYTILAKSFKALKKDRITE